MTINPGEFTFRAACHEDLDEFADLYCTLWTNSLRNRGDSEDAMVAGRYNISMQFNRSPITIVTRKMAAASRSPCAASACSTMASRA